MKKGLTEPPSNVLNQHVQERRLHEWGEIGRRVAEARRAVGLTQEDLAEALGLDRTAVSKVESGKREIDSLELARLSRVLARPIDWFLYEDAPALVSYRRELGPSSAAASGERLLDSLVRDVELLLELGLLTATEHSEPFVPENISEAVDAAASARRIVGQPQGPISSLADVAERLGVFAFCHELPPGAFEGAYVSLPQGGVALVDGSLEFVRRRFTLAHELGHHFMGADYALDWRPGRDEAGHEALVNVFAINLLIPRDDLASRWRDLRGSADVREFLLRTSFEYRVSWSALCAHARNLELIDESMHRALSSQLPKRAELMERGLYVLEDVPTPLLSPAFVSGVLKGYRQFKLARERALEILRGTLAVDDLPQLPQLPLEALRSEFD
ncbi:MAG TPA: XRE family transcriptional regulator [Actinomycetota bacterium]|nr:XRE family transcriptional regulator [Actinomycetota bacterium]